jgi:UDPglucose 6-dehydrogenase
LAKGFGGAQGPRRRSSEGVQSAADPVPGHDRSSASVAVVGAGYVGLTTAVCLAQLGHRVTCGESDPHKLERLVGGEPTIFEEGLAELLSSTLSSGRLRFVGSAADAVVGAEFVFLCVPTPQRPDGSADVTFLEAAAREVAPGLERDAVVINKSTVPVGSVSAVEAWIGRADVAVVSNPEFLREGTAISDFLHPDRVVVGAEDPAAAARVGRLFAATGAPLIVTDATSSETIKYACNAFLATKLSFVNAVATLCETLGADVRDVLLGMAYDHRIGFDYLRPGPGWGGSCLPKDTKALLHIAAEAGYDFGILRSAMTANDTQLASVVGKVRQAVGGALVGKPVGAWGLAFKAGTDDRRDSPAVEVVARLLAEGARVRAYDPTVAPDTTGLPQGLELAADAYGAAAGAEALVVLTEWDEFRWLEHAKVHEVMARPQVVDARNLLDPAALRRLGFNYIGVGRT